MSLKCMIDKWLHKGQINQEEYDAVMKKLDGHDKQIIKNFIDKLAEELYSRHSADSAWEEYSANTIIDEMIDISEKMIKC